MMVIVVAVQPTKTETGDTYMHVVSEGFEVDYLEVDNLGDIPDGQTSLFGQFLERQAPDVLLHQEAAASGADGPQSPSDPQRRGNILQRQTQLRR